MYVAAASLEALGEKGFSSFILVQRLDTSLGTHASPSTKPVILVKSFSRCFPLTLSDEDTDTFASIFHL